MKEYNILIDKLPTKINCLEINTDFRTCILFELLMKDNKINNESKIIKAINLFYDKQDLFSYNLKEILNNIMYLYTGKISRNEDNEKNEVIHKGEKSVYNYEQDIYTAFMQEYNIDLNKIQDKSKKILFT